MNDGDSTLICFSKVVIRVVLVLVLAILTGTDSESYGHYNGPYLAGVWVMGGQEGVMTSFLLRREEEEHVTFYSGERRISTINSTFGQVVGSVWVKTRVAAKQPYQLDKNHTLSKEKLRA